ncbi:tripartite tricarboxylate transporter TctB family protein [Aliiruegeria sabulilitoris]|uniref:tripartite tricarboxylate transporter TctB family protein n=1 Tax=Aliiruegeria sabulilitoris TaxID=1510458 RepID=UPI0008358157|nr:tripartite tricarboxylate transporter TctB family protein [Aliiruegeria sabulilitoris]NDR58215.1 tripartite tricarboxylate transporter TctB family protein [Pseudoruegeria sp. M32A2M]
MINKDIITGAVLIGAGAWFAWEAQSFPTMGGMTYGPGLFPTIAGLGLVLCGVLILVTGLMQPAVEEAPAETGPKSNWPLINALAIIASVVFFALGLDPLGFHVVAFPVLLVLLLLFRIIWWKALLLAVFVTFLVHFIFYSFLHVPLPWGLLEPIAW